jgi:hypothetical protein
MMDAGMPIRGFRDGLGIYFQFTQQHPAPQRITSLEIRQEIGGCSIVLIDVFVELKSTAILNGLNTTALQVPSRSLNIDHTKIKSCMNNGKYTVITTSDHCKRWRTGRKVLPPLSYVYYSINTIHIHLRPTSYR